MTMGGTRVLWLCAGLLAGLWCGPLPVASAAPLDDGRALYRQKKYAEARAVLEPLVAADPSNAAATYFLGMTVLRAGGPGALDSSRTLLGKAVKLAPGNAGYLSDYAGVCLLLADRDNSFGLALEGSSAMSRAIEANPDDLEAREGLMQFYAKAPWPLGDPPKALAMAGEIAKRDPKRGLAAYLSIAAIFDRRGLKEDALAANRAAQSLAPARKD
jgi:tetratricopeptide (TPR) repeat protein